MARLLDELKAKEKTDPYDEYVKNLPKGKTAGSYLKEFNAFLKWVKLTPPELYQLAVECYTSTDPSEKMYLVNKIADYVEWVLKTKTSETVKGKKLGYGKGKLIKQAIFKYFSVNGIKFHVDKNHKLEKVTEATPSDLRKPSKEEIYQLISICTVRVKCAVSLSKDSGLRVSDLVKVQWKHIKDGYNSPDGFGGFSIVTTKTHEVALPMFGDETTKWLRMWIPELEGILGRKLEDEDYIFPAVKDSDRRGTPIEAGSLGGLIGNQIENLGLQHQISANSLRYAFESNMETRLNQNLIKKIQGKAIGDSTRSYSKHEIEEVLPLYRGAYDALRVEGSDNKAELVEQRALIRKLQERVDAQAEEIEDNRQSRQLTDQFIRDYFGNEVDEYVRKEKAKGAK
jgi:integrase